MIELNDSEFGRVTCAFDYGYYKRTSCFLRLGRHWTVRSHGGCTAACPHQPSTVSITVLPPITADGPHPSISTILSLSEVGTGRKRADEWSGKRWGKEKKVLKIWWQAFTAGGNFRVELCKDGCWTYTPVCIINTDDLHDNKEAFTQKGSKPIIK